MGTASNLLSTERRELTATRLGTRVAILAAGHLTMIGVFFVLVEAYEPDPAGLRFESLTGFVSFVAVTSARCGWAIRTTKESRRSHSVASSC